MHQYRIEACLYNEDATAANPIPEATRYADNIEDARVIFNEFRNQKQENGKGKYQVKFYVLTYKMMNGTQFFAQFEA